MNKTVSMEDLNEKMSTVRPMIDQALHKAAETILLR
jgi:hypothetical protein